MGVYIKGMEMPKGCEDCPFFHKSDYSYKICNFPSKARRIYYGETKRQDFCPLTEVPEPHGRLVDMDKALEVIALEYGYDGIEDDMEYKVPTVIERSK